MSKLLERIIYRLSTLFQTTSCFISALLLHALFQTTSCFISGFMKDRFTLHQFLVFLNSIYENNKVQVDAIYLHFAKASVDYY